MNDQQTPTDEKQRVPTKQVVVFHLNNEEYAVPIEEVREVVKLFTITPVPNSPDFIVGVINLRGKILPIFDIEKRFHLQKNDKVMQGNIVIFENTKHELFGVCVDRVLEVLKVPVDLIKPTPEILESRIAAEFLKGVIVVPAKKEVPNSERMLLLLDFQKILDQSSLDKLQAKSDDKVVATI